MKMDARASIEIMLQAEGHLTRDGIALMTLKMPRMSQSVKSAKSSLALVHMDLRRLTSKYVVTGARQLYHNRSEVTVALQSRRAG
jgi:23S rRNA (cytidine2498-2'-O)-methyltransferase